MKALINQMSQICNEHPYKEKVLLVDSHAIGKEIIEAYVGAGYHAIHLKAKTVHELADEVMEQFYNQEFHLLDSIVGAHFIYNTLKDLNKSNKLSYFQDIEVTPSFSHSIYQTLSQLRLAGYTSENLKKEAFISLEKANDMVQMMDQYEKMLAANHFIDEAELFRQARTIVQPKKEIIYLVQSNLSLTKLAHDFLEQLLPEKIYKLRLPVIYDASAPEHKDLRSIEWSEATPFSYLYNLEELSDKPNLTLFTAKTEEVEMKQVFERIKQIEAPLDDSVIYYTKAEPYVTTVYQLSEKYQIPITFGDGLSILYSRPGRLVAGIVKWLKENYSVPVFIDLMNEGLLTLPEEAPSKSKITRYLRDAQVGWDQSRYSIQLEKLKSDVQEKLAAVNDGEKKEYYQKQINDIAWTQSWFERLFKRLPVPGTEINYYELLTGISSILAKQSNTSSVLDELAKTEMLDKINVIIPFAKETLNKYDAFEKVRELLLSLRINQSGPKPGHLHICSYKKGVYNNRTYVFIVGLDNRTFPGTPNEDPLLLDEERKQLSAFLPVLQEKGKESLYVMLQLLTHTKGPVSFSYCSFAINDNRIISPAHLFLQGYRLVTGNPNAEFKDMKNLGSPLTPTVVFEDKDYWNGLLEEGSAARLEPELLQSYQNLLYGEEAEKARKEGTFTSFDGLVNIDTSVFDPRVNKERVLSSGKLEKLATCPYSYFLEDILKLRPIEETSFDPYSWLDAATRGSLLHSIFESFYKELDGKKPDYQTHKDMIIKIAKEKIEEQKVIHQPPSERIFEQEVEDIYQCCHIFLKEEESYSENYQAKHFEYAFGIDGEKPAKITLPSNETIQVRGVVDRLDQSAAGHFHIIDYKTGSTYNYHDNKHFKGGRQLQHFIYALAIEEHLKLEAGAVQESSYYFPSVKGLGDRYVRKQDGALRTNGLDLLEKLIDVIKYGQFSMTDDANDCKFCDFKAVCRREFYPKETLEQKQMDKDAEGLRQFKEVRAYD